MKISACWIVKNEAAELAASIASVKDCAEELIVVDTGSTDDTVRIAKEHGARVEHFEWVEDFSAARNFCLSFAKGDYVIFLDADEYFEPPLCKADRNIIADIFKKTDIDTLQVNRIELDVDTGKVIGSELHARFMRRASIHYKDRIHELMTRKDEKKTTALFLENYRLMHSGYSSKRIMEKYQRNIGYLETQKRELSDEFSLFNNHAYLMREYMAAKDYDKAFENCSYLLRNYEQWENVCKIFSAHYVQRFYVAINLATVKRFSFSRKEIYKKLVQVMKKIYRATREALFIDLYYQLIFDYRGDRFLRELESVELLSAEMPALDAMESRSAEAAVYGRGALESYYRTDYDRARHLAEVALQILPDSNAGVMRALLDGSFSGTDSPVSKSILKGDYKTAYEQIMQGFENRPLDYRLLEFLDIIAEKECGELAYAARRLYDIKRDMLDEAIDLSDLVNTGYVDSEEVKKQLEALKNISFEMFTKTFEKYKSRPVTEDILTLYGLAAPIYELKGLPVAALRSHLLLYAKNRDAEKHQKELLRLLLMCDKNSDPRRLAYETFRLLDCQK